MLNALRWLGCWIASWHSPRCRIYEHTGADLIQALKLTERERNKFRARA